MWWSWKPWVLALCVPAGAILTSFWFCMLTTTPMHIPTGKAIVSSELWAMGTIMSAATKYYNYCIANDIATPPNDLRIMAVGNVNWGGSAPMLSHCSFIGTGTYLIANFVPLLNIAAQFMMGFYFILPDVIINRETGNGNTFDIESVTYHELSHASHYKIVGNNFWRDYIDEIVRSSISNSDNFYGTKNTAPRCGVGEMWAGYHEYYLTNNSLDLLYDNHLVNIAWIRPQVLVNISVKTGLTPTQVFSALKPSVTDITKFKNELLKIVGNDIDKRKQIHLAFMSFYDDDYSNDFYVYNASPMPKEVIFYDARKTEITASEKTFIDCFDETLLIKDTAVYNYPNIHNDYQFKFVNEFIVYDTCVHIMPLMTYYEWNKNVVGDFFNRNSWVSSFDTLNKCTKFTFTQLY